MQEQLDGRRSKKRMKNLITLCLVILTFVSYSQTPKFITVKRWKNGVLVSTKSYPLVNKIEVTKVKYVPVKTKSKPKVVEVKVPVEVGMGEGVNWLVAH